MSTPVETIEALAAVTISTLSRPAGMGNSSFDRVSGVWTWHAPDTTFVAVEGQDIVWLLTGSACDTWQALSVSDARNEWAELVALGYTRSDTAHTVEVVALATLETEQRHVINDDWNCYSAGVARAAVCPVLRSRDRRSSSWTICFAVECTEVGKHSARAVGSRSVEPASIYGYEVATAIRSGASRWGCTFEGLADDIFVKAPHANGVSYIAA